ncbi:MAG: undecaprenyl/decaprenyl-phosphate alpha-N-acetylglucosaminyl 1-phosphate transferase [Spirochaetaceae bacterium]|jgi:UDP-GlcNAc:undecaprenyl-phosphate GlcNAc-1-phosphate transferase|nr:undecaprenyl/decaprenyl-phosphate alpha-N-acetylglucosaminyl 1-phosphate transferase [Spirochaetaceae bacterium]
MNVTLILYVVSAFVLSAVFVPVILWVCRRFNWYDSFDERKVHTGLIPRLGGVGFVSAFVIVVCVLLFFTYPGWGKRFLPLIAGGLIILVFGVVDDFKNLSGRIKLLVQVIVSLIVLAGGFRFISIGPIQLGWVGYALTFAWLIGVINAFNLIDGIDGLCGGLSFFGILTFGLVFLFRTEDNVLAAVCFVLAASVAGFLLYNKPQAKIFMGDGGSQFLGYMIAILPLLSEDSGLQPNKALMMVVICAIPLFDTVAAMWRRLREGRSFFSPDRAHLHHKLLNLNCSVPKILAILYTLQLFLCGVVFAASGMSVLYGFILLMGAVLVVTIFFTALHFMNRRRVQNNKVVSEVK